MFFLNLALVVLNRVTSQNFTYFSDLRALFGGWKRGKSICIKNQVFLVHLYFIVLIWIKVFQGALKRVECTRLFFFKIFSSLSSRFIWHNIRNMLIRAFKVQFAFSFNRSLSLFFWYLLTWVVQFFQLRFYFISE